MQAPLLGDALQRCGRSARHQTPQRVAAEIGHRRARVLRDRELCAQRGQERACGGGWRVGSHGVTLLARAARCYAFSCCALDAGACGYHGQRAMLAWIDKRRSSLPRMHFLRRILSACAIAAACGLAAPGSARAQAVQLVDGRMPPPTAGDGASGDNFGIATVVDGEYAVIGAYGDTSVAAASPSASARGRSRVQRVGSDWLLRQKILPQPDGEDGDNFGVSLASAGDLLDRCAASRAPHAPEAGGVFRYQRVGSGYEQRQLLLAGIPRPTSASARRWRCGRTSLQWACPGPMRCTLPTPGQWHVPVPAQPGPARWGVRRPFRCGAGAGRAAIC